MRINKIILSTGKQSVHLVIILMVFLLKLAASYPIPEHFDV